MVTGPGPRRATARDVAERAGRSLSTVSLVINGKDQGRVAAQTRAMVLAAAAELGYRLNTTASALARGALDSIGFVSPDPTNPFFSMVLEGLARSVDQSLSVSVLMPHRGEDYDLTTVQRALAGNLAGLILASPGTKLLEDFVATCPTVVLDSDGSAGAFPSIDLDVRHAAGQLAGYLVSLGHRRVAYLGVSRDKASLQHRRDGLETGLRRLGAGLAVPDLVLGELAIDVARDGFRAAWAAWRAAAVTAVVCGDDLYAYGVMRACRDLGVAIPGELSLIGFNDLPYSELTDPQLTTVNLSATELGGTAAELLREFIATGRPPLSRVLSTSLVVRGSTGPAATGPAARNARG
ncbi:MAG TPA: LacI family DNA-binding transcriptional regulator [Streptosporangiaceae bacterium]|nr:LacI family DNA-binding transcriptional regulator [Streptosporangiaceae bacterium]